MNLRRVVVLSGAGISAESGLKTFRDSDGLWEGYRLEEVATPQGWRRDPQQVLDFYNARRRQAQQAQPNAAHRILADLERELLEQGIELHIVTQNVDDLHERAGSRRVLHLHGELFKVRSTSEHAHSASGVDEQRVYPIAQINPNGWELRLGDLCEDGHQLRPHIVWFGEAVLLIGQAAELASSADAFVVVGTSLSVYPAAGLLEAVPHGVPVWVVDPRLPPLTPRPLLTAIPEIASVGLRQVAAALRRWATPGPNGVGLGG